MCFNDLILLSFSFIIVWFFLRVFLKISCFIIFLRIILIKFYLKHKIKFASMKNLIDYSLLLVVVDQTNDIYDVVPLRLQMLHYSPYPTLPQSYCYR